MPSAPPPVRPDAPTGIPHSTFVLLAAFAAFAFTIIVPTMLRDGDTGWHLVAGAWIVAHAAVPTTDPFSYSVVGRPWVAHEWLSEVTMYASYRLAGWSGVIVLIGATMAALFALVAAELRRWMSARASIIALSVLATALLPSLVARPHMLVLPILAGWTIALLHAREHDRAPPLPVAAMMLIWANAHGSYVFGLALVGVFALEALLAAEPSDRGTVIQRWALFGIASAIAAAVTPWGVHGLAFPFYLNDLKALGQINEWQPSDFTSFSGFEAILLVSLAALLARPIRIPPLRLLLVLGMLHLTLQHTRHEIILVTVGLLVLARPLGRAWRRRDTGGSKFRAPDSDRLKIAVLVSVLAVGLTTYRIAVPVVRTQTKDIPVSALAHLPTSLRHLRVFNEYGFGGSLILAGIRPYIDGRADMYGDAFTLDYFAIARGDAARWRAANAKWHFGWTILPPRSRLVVLLDQDPAWRRIYADDTAVVHQAVPLHRPNP